MSLIINEICKTSLDRVKSVQFHPTKSLLLVSLYSGDVLIWDIESKQTLKTYHVTDLPIRSSVFIYNKDWIACGCDDNIIRIYNYKTDNIEFTLTGHNDYIRKLCSHPTKSYLLSSSDDMTIKLWNLEEENKLIRTFTGHLHYVMSIQFHPTNPELFISCCLHGEIKVWNINDNISLHTYSGHDKGINCITFFSHENQLSISSGSDDYSIKLWNYENKHCFHTISNAHTGNITTIQSHTTLPIVISGSEDNYIKIWNIYDYSIKYESNIDNRIWDISLKEDLNLIAIGHDSGFTLLEILGNSRQKSALK